jgi:hypothetical protein
VPAAGLLHLLSPSLMFAFAACLCTNQEWPGQGHLHQQPHSLSCALLSAVTFSLENVTGESGLGKTTFINNLVSSYTTTGKTHDGSTTSLADFQVSRLVTFIVTNSHLLSLSSAFGAAMRDVGSSMQHWQRSCLTLHETTSAHAASNIQSPASST